jgi:HYD1 signature containing ADP-ribosyltransferase
MNGHFAIIESGVFCPSLTKKNGRDVLFGEGQYFTNIAPEMIVARSQSQMTPAQIESGQISLLQLSRYTMGGTLQLEKLDYFIEFDVSELAIVECNEYIYLHQSSIGLNVRDLIIRSGRTFV